MVKRKRRRQRREDGSRARALFWRGRERDSRAVARIREQNAERESSTYPFYPFFFRFSHLQKRKNFNARALGKREKRRSREHKNARETSRSRQCRRELSVPLSFFCRFLNRPNKRARGRRCRRCRRRRRSRFEREEKKRKKFGRRTGIGSANAKRRSRRSDSFVRGRHRGR